MPIHSVQLRIAHLSFIQEVALALSAPLRVQAVLEFSRVDRYVHHRPHSGAWVMEISRDYAPLNNLLFQMSDPQTGGVLNQHENQTESIAEAFQTCLVRPRLFHALFCST